MLWHDPILANQMGRDIKIFRMNRLGMPQDRIAERLGMIQRTIHNHLEKMAALPKLLNADLRVTFRLARGFTVAQVAQKQGWSGFCNAEKKHPGRYRTVQNSDISQK